MERLRADPPHRRWATGHGAHARGRGRVGNGKPRAGGRPLRRGRGATAAAPPGDQPPFRTADIPASDRRRRQRAGGHRVDRSIGVTSSVDLVAASRTYTGAPAPAVSRLSLHVAAGDAVAVLGPSGSGKTTVLRLIAGLDVPDEGDIRIADTTVLGVPPERRGIAMVSQSPRLFPHMSVLDNVAFGPQMSGVPKRQARQAAERYLDLVHLPGMGRRRPATLSGGQQQRVALARALAAEPAVLLLDEPFSALDPSLRADMHRLVTELRALLQPTIVLVTHDHQEAALLADSVAILIDGQLQQHVAAAALYDRPNSLTVSRFLGCLNEVPGHARAGRHVSALGTIDTAYPDGQADGDAVLVIRQEAIALTRADDPAANATGCIERTTPRGARTLVEIATTAGLLFAEVQPGRRYGHGDVVGLVLPADQCVVIPTASRTVTAGQVPASPVPSGR
ncbi:MAG: ATP-binding cassette domain-containing protein [Actinomycetales bacterium]|nr:ATP-binding cassette domain-containing protein [Actinomycetales bacterium]